MRFTKAIAIRFTKAIITATLAVAFLAMTPVKAFARDHDGDHRGEGYYRHGYYNQDDQGDQGDHGYYNQDDQGDQGDQGYYNQNDQGYQGYGYYGRGGDDRREYYEHLRHERWEHERWARQHGYGYYGAPAPYINFGVR